MLPIWAICDGSLGCGCPKKKKAMLTKGLFIEHGTRSGYQRGCRCRSCTAANTEATRDYRRINGRS